MKQFIKILACFAISVFLILLYSIFDITKTIRVTFLITGILQGNVLSFKASGEPYNGLLVGGMPYIISKIEEIKKNALKKSNAFFILDCGDNFPGTAQSYYSQCKVVIDTMNLMGISAMLLGNREFDYGLSLLLKRASEAKFPIISSNVLNKNTNKPFNEFKEWLTLNIKNTDLKIGILGLTPLETVTDSSLKNVSDITMRSLDETINLFKEYVKSNNINFTIVLSQLDFEKDLDLIKKIVDSNIDMIIGLDFTNQILGVRKINNTFLVPLNGLSKGASLTKLNMVFDRYNLKVIDCGVELISVIVENIKPNIECVNVITDYLRKLDALMNQVIGVTNVILKRPFNEETNFGNLITDYMRYETSADVALQNAGSFRADINIGEITVSEFYNALPFDNDIVLLEIQGDVLFDIINTCCKRERGLLQISGGKYKYNPNKIIQSNLNNVSSDKFKDTSENVLISFKINNEDVDFKRKYLVATNSFLASGQGGYPQFKSCKVVKYYDNLRETAIRYIKKAKVIEPKVEGRIIREVSN